MITSRLGNMTICGYTSLLTKCPRRSSEWEISQQWLQTEREATAHPNFFFNLSTTHYSVISICRERTYFINFQYMKLALFSVTTSHLKILSSELWHVNKPLYFTCDKLLEDKTVYITIPHICITKEETHSFGGDGITQKITQINVTLSVINTTKETLTQDAVKAYNKVILTYSRRLGKVLSIK